MRAAAALFLAALAACAGPPPPATPPAEPPPWVVRLAPGASDTVGVAGARAATAPAGLAATLVGGRLALRAEAGFEGLALVALDTPAGPRVVPVQAPGPGGLTVRRVGPRASDPTVFELVVSPTEAEGGPALDDETAVVALVGDAVFEDNAIDLDVSTGRIGLDLDAVPPGRWPLRLAVRAGPVVSNWVEVAVADRRAVARP